jgi:hypothetical protein
VLMKSLIYLLLHYLIVFGFVNHLLLKNFSDYIPKIRLVKLSHILMSTSLAAFSKVFLCSIIGGSSPRCPVPRWGILAGLASPPPMDFVYTHLTLSHERV